MHRSAPVDAGEMSNAAYHASLPNAIGSNNVRLAILSSWTERYLIKREAVTVGTSQSAEFPIVGHANRLRGYFAAVIAATLSYLVWIAAEDLLINPKQQVNLLSILLIVMIVELFSILAVAVSMLVPWGLAIWGSTQHSRPGGVHFALAGASAAFILGCVASSLSPKPLFVEDQSFARGLEIAAQREGLGLFFSGLFGGLIYWSVSERRRWVRGLSSQE